MKKQKKLVIWVFVCLILNFGILMLITNISKSEFNQKNNIKYQQGDRFYDDLQQIINDIYSKDSAGWVEYFPIVEKIQTTQKYYKLSKKTE